MSLTIKPATLARQQADDAADYYRIGQAYAMLTKEGAAPVAAPVLHGRLIVPASGWALLTVPNSLVRGLFDAMDETGIELPPGHGDQPFNAHISVLTKDEVDKLGGPDAISERGHPFNYQLGPIMSVEPKGWSEMSRVWFVKVKSPELKALRRSYGLTPLPNGDHEFHASVAVRRKKVLSSGPTSKAAAADDDDVHNSHSKDVYSREEGDHDDVHPGRDGPVKIKIPLVMRRITMTTLSFGKPKDGDDDDGLEEFMAHLRERASKHPADIKAAAAPISIPEILSSWTPPKNDPYAGFEGFAPKFRVQAPGEQWADTLTRAALMVGPPAALAGGLALWRPWEHPAPPPKPVRRRPVVKAAATMGEMAHEVYSQLPRMRLPDTLAGAGVGALGGLGYDWIRGADPGEGRWRKRIGRVLAGAGAGALGANVVGDRARRYISNTLVPFGYKPDSVEEQKTNLHRIWDAGIMDRPEYGTGHAKGLERLKKYDAPVAGYGPGAKDYDYRKDTLENYILPARREIVRRQMGVHTDDPVKDLWVAGPNDQLSLNPNNPRAVATAQRFMGKLKGGIPGEMFAGYGDPARWINDINLGKPHMDSLFETGVVGGQSIPYKKMPSGDLEASVLDRWDYTLDPKEDIFFRKNMRNMLDPAWRQAKFNPEVPLSGYLTKDQFPTNESAWKALAGRWALDNPVAYKHPWITQRFRVEKDPLVPKTDSAFGAPNPNRIQMLTPEGLPFGDPITRASNQEFIKHPFVEKKGTSRNEKSDKPINTEVAKIRAMVGRRRRKSRVLDQDEDTDEQRPLLPLALMGTKTAADYAPGLPSKTDMGHADKLRVGQMLDWIVQQHDAERAGRHYDVRFGNKDTGLLSWAARKGLPEPGAKHLAVQQPVHRYGYKDFEGEIPEGYGKGTVKKHTEGQVLITKVTPQSIHFTTAHQRHPERYTLARPKGWGNKDWLMMNTTPRDEVPYEKVKYKKISPDQVEPHLRNMQEGDTVEAKVDGASQLVQLAKGHAEMLSFRTSKTTGRPIFHTERFFGGRPDIPVPRHLEGSVLKGEMYASRLAPHRGGLRTAGGDNAVGGGPEGGAGHTLPPSGAASVSGGPAGGAGRLGPQDIGTLLNSSIAHSLQIQKERGLTLKNMLFDVRQYGRKPIDPSVTSRADRRKMLEEIAGHLPKDKFHVAEEARDPEAAVKLWDMVRSGQHPLTEEGLIFHPKTGIPSKAKLMEEHDVHITGTFPGEGKRKATIGGFTYGHEPTKTVGKVGTGFSDDFLKEVARDPSAYTGRVARLRAQQRLPSGALRAPSFLGLHEDTNKIAMTKLAGFFGPGGPVSGGAQGIPDIDPDINPGIDQGRRRQPLPPPPPPTWLDVIRQGLWGDSNAFVPDLVRTVEEKVQDGAGMIPKTGEFHPALADLKKAKFESDRKNYKAKHHILSGLLSRRPGEFVQDSVDGNIIGLIHKPTKFRIHAPARIVRGRVKAAGTPEEVRLAQQRADTVQANRDYADRYWGQTALSPLAAVGDAMGRAGYAIRGGFYGAGGTAMGALAAPVQGVGRAGQALGVPGSNVLTSGADAFANQSWGAAKAGVKDIGSYLSDPNPKGHVNAVGEANRAMFDQAGENAMGGAYRGADWLGYLATQGIAGPAAGKAVRTGLGAIAKVAPQATEAVTAATRSSPVGNYVADVVGNLGQGATAPIQGGLRSAPLAAGKGMMPTPTPQLFQDIGNTLPETTTAARTPMSASMVGSRPLGMAAQPRATGMAVPQAPMPSAPTSITAPSSGSAMTGSVGAGAGGGATVGKSASVPFQKLADLLPWVSLQPQQKRVAERVGEGQNLLVYHGLGSGKSLAGIAAAEGVGGPYTAVVPASLRPNYQGEISKFTNKRTPTEVMSYTGVGMGKQPLRTPNTIIMDEVQRIRNPDSLGSRAAMEMAMKAPHRILLSGTPIVNSPSDLAAPLSILTGDEISPAAFNKQFVGSKMVSPGFMGWLQGVKPAKVSTIQDEKGLERLLANHVDYQPSRTPEGVKTQDERVEVDLSPEQQDFYKLMWGKLPWMLRWKLSNDYPLSGQELGHLSAFMTGPRQAALSLYPYHSSHDPMYAFKTSSKLQSAMGSLKQTLAKDPRSKALVYSNFIDAGLTPYAAALKAEGIPFGQFHGTLSEEERKQNLADYNAGKLRVLLLGPAAAEGISAKGTQLIQLLDPHWNEARLGQARGRGLRFDSHEGLPEELRDVKIQRFVAKMPPPGWLGKLFGAKPRPSADEVLEQQSKHKEELNEQFREVLRRVGSPGYQHSWSLFG